jgi:SAM-dependent methyltransferase
MNKLKDNKKFWQRYAPVYWMFVRSAGKAYDEIAEKISKYINRDSKVLELACGTGEFTFRLAKKCKNWTATDFSEKMLKEAKNTYDKRGENIEGLCFERQDATNLPYEDESFDAVMIANALHIMPEPEKALAEIKRVLMPGGLLFAPTFMYREGSGFLIRSGFFKLFGFKAYMNLHGKEFAEFIENQGFQVLECDIIKCKVSPLCCLIARKSEV